MPNTYSQIYIQIVFAVKGRENLIKESFRDELEKYMSGIVSGKNQKLLAIYCMSDHTHLLIGLRPSMSVADLVRDIKSNSSAFISEKGFVKGRFAWQEGYGAFSYSKSQLDNVIHYILNQPIHHQKKTFRDEYIDFLQKFQIDYDEKFLFEWIV
ncbi:REP element-mobilizing transposase RayT [Flexibacter flexilis DSM 6793]|uniref:REP element-mobilizing transposase RayT n=1 Tax=Flexibacter flexilis DSM 6793 TaxID=927664 RepID=A0A1I1MFP3_9BACT|nr:IS200/IS605 family transposase [Flexibacter flexilis]SFC83642.1 REP element-mobilizing transposase RayT [Flexibacter flexilis DSM 6793]